MGKFAEAHAEYLGMYNLKLFRNVKDKIFKKALKGATQLPDEEDIDDHKELYDELRSSSGDRQTSICANTDCLSVGVVLSGSEKRYIVPIKHFKSMIGNELIADFLFTRKGKEEVAAIKIQEIDVKTLMSGLREPAVQEVQPASPGQAGSSYSR